MITYSSPLPIIAEVYQGEQYKLISKGKETKEFFRRVGQVYGAKKVRKNNYRNKFNKTQE